MKYSTKSILKISLELSSSELVMMNQGGKHAIDLSSSEFSKIEDGDWDEVNVTVGLDPSELSRHKHVFGAAQMHLANLTPHERLARTKEAFMQELTKHNSFLAQNVSRFLNTNG